ncbi:MAG: LPS export ABC transporter periplasmic protein LptC [Drouetiella hepatica Uher 2000/2452]|jgi:LPS export ABC transporter protein LptC|uniref:LPS export ABC transporter periplasmic protein LptC n=1 Tax=Drouetiella hepatica Uher 2000/2452 TaxID=904376 RepID=A0A951Q715_9CYAN|nr:LPS export ABC transporter periplasmic protein LptC [Drouetiella hepatica Uher 2000/2452]
MAERKTALLLLVLALTLNTSCRQGSQATKKLAEDSSAAQQASSNLTFDNITLEQADDGGQILWKVKAKQAIYSPDQKIANVISPDGDIYQNGKAIYHVQAQRGEVLKDGDRIFLRGQVVATDLKSGAVLRGDELEWRPKPDVMTIRGNLRGTHTKLKMSSNQAKLMNRQRRMELSGQVIALTQQEPKARMQSERLIWEMDKDLVTSDRPVQVQRIQGDRAIDQAEGQQAEANLTTKIIKLKQNANLVLFDPPLQIAGNSLIWDLSKQTLVADQPVTILHRQKQITVTANAGQMDLTPKIGRLNGNVHAVNPQNQSELFTDRLVWDMPTQRMNADGNITYNQNDPPATLRGARALGRLDNNTMVVSGGTEGGDGRVVTEIVPEDFN